MRRREYLLWAALMLAGCLWLTGFVRHERAEHSKWEYTVVYARSYEGATPLNRVGEEKWELVAVVAGQNPSDPQTFYFKRAR